MDGSTDSSAKEQETLCVRTWNKGKITCQFLCIDEPWSTTANDHDHMVQNDPEGEEEEDGDDVDYTCIFKQLDQIIVEDYDKRNNFK